MSVDAEALYDRGSYEMDQRLGEPSRHFGIGGQLPDGAKRYRKKTVVAMVRMDAPFTCDSREGHRLQGQAGDFLVPDGHGGFYPVSAQFHAENYESTGEPQ